MKPTKHILLTIALLLCSLTASAEDFSVDGIYYNITSSTNKTVEVTYKGNYYNSYSNEYSGSITLPATVTYNGVTYSVTSIGNSAFYGCSSLTSITIPESVTSIGNYAFSDCSSLTAITIPEGVTSIGNSAFSGCSSLTTITIPESVTSIEKSAFNGTAWYDDQPDGVLYIGKMLYNYKGNMPENTAIEVKEGTVSISPCAFQSCSNLTAITIPESVTSIGDWAFDGCIGLTDITIPGSVSLIRDGAFANCTGLTSIIIPENMTSIANFAFYYCSSLTSITIPESVTSIGNNAFYNCSGITAITCKAVTPPAIGNSYTFDGVDKSILIYVPAESVEAYKAAAYWSEFTNYQPLSSDIASGTCGDNLTWRLTEEYELVIEGTGEMYDYTHNYGTQTPWEEYRSSIKEVTIFEGVTSIGEHAFYDCDGLTSITIPENSQLTSIGNGAFEDCSSLTSITIPEGVTSIGNYAFAYCSSLTAITIPEGVTSIGECTFSGCSSLTSITILEGVTSIGRQAFCACNLISIYIPASVTSIGKGAFANNPNLAEIVVNQGNSYYDSRNSCNAIIEKANGQLVAGCTSTLIPEGVTTIGYGAFCVSNLSSIDIPKSVTSIGDYAFNYCSSLTAITIPEGVTSIGEWAFDGCSSLTTITCNAATPPTIYPSTFLGVDKSIPVYVPAGSVEAYKAAAYWSEFANLLALPTYVANITLGQSEAMLTEGETLTLTATVTPDDVTDKTLTWSSSDERVATVDAAGLVTALAPGTATITVAANDGSGVSASCVVTVKAKPTVRCAAPVMDYVDGQVVLTCDTEGVEFVTDVVAEGAQRYQTSTFDLAAVYTITAYATKEGYLDSDPVTLTLCWVPCTEEHEDDDTDGIITLPAKPVLIQTAGGVITLTGLPDGAEVAVYDTAGTSLAAATAENGTATLTTNLNTGSTAIVKIGGHSVKVVVK